VQRVVTVAGDSVVGAEGRWVKVYVIEGKRVIGSWRRGGAAANEPGRAKGKRVGVAEKKRCKSIKSRL